MSVAVVDPLPLFRAGVEAELAAAGHVVEQIEDLAAWPRRGPLAVAILTLDSEQAWLELTTAAARLDWMAIIVLIPEGGVTAGARAVRLGARCVLPRAASAEMLRLAVQAATDGLAVLPADVLHDVTTGTAHGARDVPRLTGEQLGWLRTLARGGTVTDLAARAGYSERAMHRLLQRVYEQLGVQGRTQALIRAQSLGLIDPV
ncbi:DNA-binding response regulator [Dactylosporangium sp. NPDC049742]|uniref:DNA-binding response regulator n=1 Tax=Dactylosporangium sp. NPDC049742 TaxID=3154737 RepID=UPI003420C39A